MSVLILILITITDLIYYCPQRSWGKEIVSVACVKNSVHRGGSASVHAPWELTPPHRTPLPRDQAPKADTPPKRRHPLEQTHPLCSAPSEIWSTSGRYAPSWNAILLQLRSNLIQQIIVNLV